MGQENDAPRKINGVEGALGQLMQSQGPGVVEKWADPSAIGVDYGLSFFGTVSGVAGAPNFQCSDLAGFDADFFDGYWVYVVWDAGGAAAQPQGQMVECTGYAAGDFTAVAFAPNVIAIGDKVLLLHPSIAAIIDAVFGLEAIKGLVDSAEAAGPFSYLDAGGEQDVIVDALTTRRRIWLDTFRIYRKVDGGNYDLYAKQPVTIGADEERAWDAEFTVNQGWKLTYEEDVDEGAARAIPYNIITQVIE